MQINDTATRQFVLNPIKLEVWDSRGKLVACKMMTNSRTQAGGVAASNAQFAGTGISFKYVGLTSNAAFAPANGDTTLSTEITTVGLARVLGTPVIGTTQTALNGTVATTITASWTATGSITVYGAGLFSAISFGILGYEATCTATPVANLYTVNATWTLNE